jgi:outer membrane protein assembly factor BamB
MVPFVADGLVVMSNVERGISAYDEDTGHLRWKTEEECSPALIHGSLILALERGEHPQLRDLHAGTIVAPAPLGVGGGGGWAVGAGDRILDGVTGREWCYSVSERAVVWRRADGAPTPSGQFAADEQRLINGVRNGSIRCLAVDSGERLWEASVADLSYYIRNLEKTFPGHVDGPFHILDGSAIFNVPEHVVCVSMDTGERRWAWRAEGAPYIREGFLYGAWYYVLLEAGGLRVLSPATGRLEQSFDLSARLAQHIPSARVTSPLLVSETHIWTGSWQGYVVAFDRRTGDVDWYYRPDDALSTEFTGSAFVVANGRLYYGDNTYQHYCLKELASR